MSLWLYFYQSVSSCLFLKNMCFCLKTIYLTYVVDSLTLNSWRIALLLIPDWSLSNPNFLHNAHYILLGLATLASTATLHLGAILNSKITNKKSQTHEKHGTKYHKNTPVYYVRTATGRQSVTLLDLSWEHAQWAIQILHHSVHVCEGPRKHHKYWFGDYK